MKSLRTTLVATGLLALAAAAACSPTDQSGDRPSGGHQLSFTVDGASFGTRSFGPELTEVEQHWVYDPQTERTHIHISGVADGPTPLRVGIDLSVPRSGPGTYDADTSFKGMDRGFSVALADHATAEKTALVGTHATLVLEPNVNEPDWMTGTFSGRFAVGHRTTGRDILGIPPEEREYAEIRDGRFRVRWRDSLHGRGQRWPAPPAS